jgi:cell division transport system ATP-binding protein
VGFVSIRGQHLKALHFPDTYPLMIKLDSVTKIYKDSVKAIQDVSLDVARGEFVFVVGPSGSGKSTLIRLLLKEEEPTRGQIFVAGKNIGKLSAWKVPYLRRNLGTVFQDFKLLADKTVFSNVAFALEVIGQSKAVIHTRVPEILDLVGLKDKLHNYPDELSGGEQQRVSIARAFVNRPLILLADEPTGNLDPATSVDIMKLLDRINRTGTTVIMATHDNAIVDAMRRRVVELEEGRMVRDQARGVYGYGA